MYIVVRESRGIEEAAWPTASPPTKQGGAALGGVQIVECERIPTLSVLSRSLSTMSSGLDERYSSVVTHCTVPKPPTK